MPVVRQVDDATTLSRGGVSGADGRSAELDRTVILAQAAKCADHVALALTFDTGEPDDLAGPHREGRRR